MLFITWKNQLGHACDLDLNVKREFKFETIPKEGWSATYNMMTDEFIVSDGTYMLCVWDRDTLEKTRRVNGAIQWADGNGAVNSQPLHYLN